MTHFLRFLFVRIMIYDTSGSHVHNAPIKSKLQHPPTKTPAIWPFSLPREWGIWFVRPSRGWGFDLCLVVIGKIEPEVSGFFFRALKSPTRLDEMEWIFFFALALFSHGQKNEFAARQLDTLAAQANPTRANGILALLTFHWILNAWTLENHSHFFNYSILILQND